MEPVAFPLGEHLVVEAEGMLSCQKCGRSAPLTEADKFAETRCGPEERPTQTTQQQAPTPPVMARPACDICRAREGVEKVPILDSLNKAIQPKLQCMTCYDEYLRMLRAVRLPGRFGRITARAPPNAVWFDYGDNCIIAFQKLGGVWPCPACDEFFDDMYSVVVHFSEKHPRMANKPVEKVSVDVGGKPVEALLTAQGYIICQCGFTAENVKHFTYHYDRDHKT
jgi:hypothetical protein